MEQQITVIKATPSDLGLITESFRDERYCFEQHSTNGKLHKKNWIILLARFENKIVGILTMKIPDKYDLNRRHIDVVQVRNGFRRMGIARLLLEHVESIVTQENKDLYLFAQIPCIDGYDSSGKLTHVKNLAAKELLLNLGFILNEFEQGYCKDIKRGNGLGGDLGSNVDSKIFANEHSLVKPSGTRYSFLPKEEEDGSNNAY